MDEQELIDQVSKMSTDEIIATAAEIRAELAQDDDAIDARKGIMNVSPYSGSVGVSSSPSSNFYGTSVSGTQMWMTGAVDSVTGHMLTELENTDRKLQLKLFIHFAKLFCEKFPSWSLVPENDDPLNKVKLIRPDIGASITSLYPMNVLAVYGGPDLWMKGRRELGQVLPIVKVSTQTFFGWALDVETPEWVR